MISTNMSRMLWGQAKKILLRSLRHWPASQGGDHLSVIKHDNRIKSDRSQFAAHSDSGNFAW